MTSQLIIRLDSEVKAKFQQCAQSEGKSASQVMRELVEGYVRDRDMEGFVQELWDRIGKNLESQGVGTEDVECAIRNVRAQHR